MTVQASRMPDSWGEWQGGASIHWAAAQGFVVYDFHTGDNTTGGTWTEGPGYNSMLGLTRFTVSTETAGPTGAAQE